MKLLAMYLPQYHEIEENNEWWGQGYTEWTAVKKAKPLFNGHNQPRMPLNNNYYDLSDLEAQTWKWQTQLAQQYGVYGFCIYHYWFKTGSQLLEKPMEILLAHPEIETKYCVCWANETWARNWYGLSDVVLKKQEYGDEIEWTNHFNYLLKFFKDKRYIKIDNKPVINIYHTYEIQEMEKMKKVWNKLAIQNKFAGVYIVSGNTLSTIDQRSDLFDAYYNFEPGYTFMHKMNLKYKAAYFIRKKFIQAVNSLFSSLKIEGKVNAKWIYKNNISTLNINGKKCFLGTFPEWDNTPRRKHKGRIYFSSAELFYKNLIDIKKKLIELNRSDDYVYINAWNEWGEGAYLEPDTQNEHLYLEKIEMLSNHEK